MGSTLCSVQWVSRGAGRDSGWVVSCQIRGRYQWPRRAGHIGKHTLGPNRRAKHGRAVMPNRGGVPIGASSNAKQPGQPSRSGVPIWRAKHGRTSTRREAQQSSRACPSRAGTPRQAEQAQQAKPGKRVKHGRTGRSTPSQTELPSRAVAARKATQAPPGQAGSPIHALRPTLSASSASQRHLEHERKCASSKQSHPGSQRRKSQ